MYRSVVAAENAAIEGQGQDFDTQQCLDLQAQVLSSSPRNTPDDDAVALTTAPSIAESLASHHSSAFHVRRELTEAHGRALAAGIDVTDNLVQSSGANHPPGERVDDVSAAGTKRLVFRRDSKGNLRPFDRDGVVFQLLDIDKKSRATMEGLTQKSSMSPTQENSESAYDQFNLHRSTQGRYVSNSADDGAADAEGEGRHTQHSGGYDSLTSKQQHSTRTDSTTHTYGENDTGHVQFDLIPEPGIQNMDENISQDGSFAARPLELSHGYSYEPQTPAPPINPFSQKGSVLKGHEMFGATQPSSIGRHIASPTSSRPSPNVYDGFSAQNRTISSPLVDPQIDERSPLQSSVRTILRSRSTDSPSEVKVPRTSSVQSFDSGLVSRRTNSTRQPRDVYVSMKESQERRIKEANPPSPESDNSDSDSDIESILKKRHREREREGEIQRQLAKVTSSRSGSANSANFAIVEVPSTGRRWRSRQEEYVAQCNGLEGHDTQQDDVIIDSQALVEDPEDMEFVASGDNSTRLPSGTELVGSRESIEAPSPKLPARTTHATVAESASDLYLNSNMGEVFSPSKDADSPLRQPSRPLQEVSTNGKDIRTPIATKNEGFSDGADSTVPETSPPEDRIRPMREIASLSFGDSLQGEAIDAPGFTQLEDDFEFENAVRPRSSISPHARGLRTQLGAGLIDCEPTPHARISTNELLEPTNSKLPQCPVANETAALETKTGDTELSTVGDGMNEIREPEKHVQDGVETVNTDDKEINGTHHEEEVLKAAQTSPDVPVPKRGGLRSKDELKGPSRALRRNGDTLTPKSSAAAIQSTQVRKSSRTAKVVPASSSKRQSIASGAMPISRSHESQLSLTANSSSVKASTRKSTTPAPVEQGATTPVPNARPSTTRSATQVRREIEKIKFPTSALQPSSRPSITKESDADEQTPVTAASKRSSKRKAAIVADGEEALLTRSSKRQSTSHSTTKESTEPVNLPATATNTGARTKKTASLFSKMAFAVSYVKQQEEKSRIVHLITEQGGRILDDGFDNLFNTGSISKSRVQAGDDDIELTLSVAARSTGFAALIADEHSRKAKYMQALALGLPCISGRWILACVAKEELIDWTPYLLCAGQSSFLGNAIRSRTLQPYPASDAKFVDIFNNREKLLEGKSILLVTGKGRAEETRHVYVFLTRILGPARIGQVVDKEQARKKLLEDPSWDLLYVDKNEDAAATIIFGASSASDAISSASRKRKRGPVEVDVASSPAPKRIRVISDEVVIQSLILGQLLEE